MIYTAKITSKGTTTIPADIREELGLKPGSEVRFDKNTKTGKVSFEKVPTIEEIHAMNKEIMKKNGTEKTLDNYKSGDGFRWHVEQKYGKFRKP